MRWSASGWTLLGVLVACSGAETPTIDIGVVASEQCARVCQRAKECTSFLSDSYVEQCTASCRDGFASGIVEVGPGCEPAVAALAGCTERIECPVQESTCATERAAFADACQPLSGGFNCALGASRLEDEACCPELGERACAQSLFCAALGDGPAMCHPNGAQLGGDACTEDQQCQSGNCNVEAGACRAGRSKGCSVAAGCVSEAYFCYRFEGGGLVCEPSSGDTGAPCRAQEDCSAGLTCTDTGEAYWVCQ